MPLNQPSTSSTTSSLYEHDMNESLESMTLIPIQQAPARRSSTGANNNCDTPPTTPTAATTTAAKSVSSPSTCLSSMVQQQQLDPTRIPRRVKSSTEHGRLSTSPGDRDQQQQQQRSRNTVTTACSRSCSSVVSSCLLSSYGGSIGSGDGSSISLDPDVDVWLDIIPLSRKPLKNFHRDFSDGVLMAEIMAHFLPKRVDLHNYPPTFSSTTKKSNWATLNQKVFSKLGLKLSDALIEGITQSKPGYIEKALKQVHRLIDNMDRKQLDYRAKELSGLASSYDGMNHTMHPPFVEDWCLVRNVPGEIPDCVIYQNIKYFACNEFDEVQHANVELRERNNELSSKVRRMETLLGLKEAHLQDLTKKIYELRGKFNEGGSDVVGEEGET